MITMKQVIEAKESYKSLDIKLSNGKTMHIDFNNFLIYRIHPTHGGEHVRNFYGNSTKMLNLCKRYLKNQV